MSFFNKLNRLTQGGMSGRGGNGHYCLRNQNKNQSKKDELNLLIHRRLKGVPGSIAWNREDTGSNKGHKDLASSFCDII